MNSEFYATNTSEVHIYIDKTFPDCPDFHLYLNQDRIKPNSHSTSGSPVTTDIEIYFHIPAVENTLSVIPNPSNGKFYIQLNSFADNSLIYQITIYDLVGREIFSSSESKKSVNLDLSAYPKGIYFLKAKDETKYYTKKIILY